MENPSSLRFLARNLRDEGFSISNIHLRHLNPLPDDLEEIMSRFKKVIVPELNLGQLNLLLCAKYLVDVISYGKLQGKPFKVSELHEKFLEYLREGIQGIFHVIQKP